MKSPKILMKILTAIALIALALLAQAQTSEEAPQSPDSNREKAPSLKNGPVRTQNCVEGSIRCSPATSHKATTRPPAEAATTQGLGPAIRRRVALTG